MTKPLCKLSIFTLAKFKKGDVLDPVNSKPALVFASNKFLPFIFLLINVRGKACSKTVPLSKNSRTAILGLVKISLTCCLSNILFLTKFSSTVVIVPPLILLILLFKSFEILKRGLFVSGLTLLFFKAAIALLNCFTVKFTVGWSLIFVPVVRVGFSFIAFKIFFAFSVT